MEVRRGDVLFFRPSNPWSWLICAILKERYSHAAYYLGMDLYVDITPLGQKIKILKKNKIGKTIIPITPKYLSQEAENKAVSVAVQSARIIKGYGWFNAVAMIFLDYMEKIRMQLFEGKRYVICSEYVANILEGNVKKKIDMFNSLITPQGLLSAFEFRIEK